MGIWVMQWCPCRVVVGSVVCSRLMLSWILPAIECIRILCSVRGQLSDPIGGLQLFKRLLRLTHRHGFIELRDISWCSCAAPATKPSQIPFSRQLVPQVWLLRRVSTTAIDSLLTIRRRQGHSAQARCRARSLPRARGPLRHSISQAEDRKNAREVAGGSRARGSSSRRHCRSQAEATCVAFAG